MKVINVIVLLIAVLFGISSELPPPPPLHPDCISEYRLLWYFPENAFCDATEPFGDVYFYRCDVLKYSDYHGWYKSAMTVFQCVYPPIIGEPITPEEVNLIFMPFMNYRMIVSVEPE